MPDHTGRTYHGGQVRNARRFSDLRCWRRFVCLPRQRHVGVDVGEREVDADLGHWQHAALGQRAWTIQFETEPRVIPSAPMLSCSRMT